MSTRHVSFLTAVLLGTQIHTHPVHADPVHIDWSQSFGDPVYTDDVFVAVDGAGNVLLAGEFGNPIDLGGGELTSAGSSDFFVAKWNPEGVHIWSKRFGGSSEDELRSIASDAAGNVFVTGFFRGTMDLGGGPLTSAGDSDIFVMSLDPTGAHRWSRRFGGSQSDLGNDLTVDDDGSVLVVGTFRDVVDMGGGPLNGEYSTGVGSGFVLRLDASGLHQWSTAILGYGGVATIGKSASKVAVSATGDVYVAGSESDCEFVCIISAYLRKYTSGGAMVWEAFEPGNTQMHAGQLRIPDIRGLAVDAAGRAYVAGRDLGCSDQTFGCGASMECYSPDKVVLWKKVFGDDTNPFALRVDTDTDDNVMLTGSFRDELNLGGELLPTNGGADIFIAKFLGTTGDHVWSDHTGSIEDDWTVGVVSPEDDQFVITGLFRKEYQPGQTTLNALVLKGGIPDFVAVAISEFDATESDGVVHLKSRFRSDFDATEVNVYRSRGTGEFRPSLIANVQNVGHSDFEYVDRDVLPGETYRYQIGVIDPDGQFLSGIVTVSMARVQARLFPNRPNPFNPATTIRFSLPSTEHVAVIVYDSAGRSVRTLVDGVRPHGTHEIAWDGRDDRGMGVSSGIYFCRLRAGNVVESQKLVLLK